MIDGETVIKLSILEAKMADALEHQRGIQRAKNYYNGIQTVFLTARAREYLDLPTGKAPMARVPSYLYPQQGGGTSALVTDFNLNIIQTIVTAVLDELSIIGFDTSEKAETDGTKKQAAWARRIWEWNKMQIKQHEVHEAALRDSEGFVMLEWDDDEKMPRIIVQDHYIDVAAGGTGQGVIVIREDESQHSEGVCAIKEWTEDGNKYRRRNVYFDDRIEKYYRDPDWKHYEPEQWPVMLKGRDGLPLGDVVISFPNPGGLPEAWHALKQQDAINKVFIDVLAEADNAFRTMVVTGSYGTSDGSPANSDGSNAISLSPGSLIGIPGEGTISPLDGGDPTKLIAALKDLILIAGQITGTPTSYFSITKQVAGVDTLKGQDKPLTKKVEKRKDVFGQSWADVMTMARRMWNAYGGGELLDETVSFYPQWKEVFDLEKISAMRDALGLPQETLWRMAGLSEEQIQAAKQTDEYKAGRVALDAPFWEGWSKVADKIPFRTYAESNGWEEQKIVAAEMQLAIMNGEIIPDGGQ